jgi:nicotinamide N-methyltransferase
MDSPDESDSFQDMFEEPTDFYSKEKEHTFETYALQSKKQLKVRLVGHNPLWVWVKKLSYHMRSL